LWSLAEAGGVVEVVDKKMRKQIMFQATSQILTMLTRVNHHAHLPMIASQSWATRPSARSIFAIPMFKAEGAS
jgi:hypothetical protein